MTIEWIAFLYVNYLEPIGKVLFYLFLVMVLLYIINVIRDGKKKTELVSKLISLIFSMIVKAFVVCGNFVKWIAKMLLNGIKLIWASIRDFFFSPI